MSVRNFRAQIETISVARCIDLDLELKEKIVDQADISACRRLLRELRTATNYVIVKKVCT